MAEDRLRANDPSPRERDEFDEPPRRRRLEDEEEETGDVTGGIIPYKNAMALSSYYCGVFGLIPILGVVLGPLAMTLGLLGFRYANRHPKARGKPHAIVGLILGLTTLSYHVAFVLWAYFMTK